MNHRELGLSGHHAKFDEISHLQRSAERSGDVQRAEVLGSNAGTSEHRLDGDPHRGLRKLQGPHVMLGDDEAPAGGAQRDTERAPSVGVETCSQGSVRRHAPVGIDVTGAPQGGHC